MHKKDFPIRVLKLLEPYLDKKNELYYRVPKKEGYLVRFLDREPHSNFFFEITNYVVDTSGGVSFEIKYSPQNDYLLAPRNTTVNSTQTENYFNSWVGHLKTYENSRSLEEPDPILKQYEEEFYNTFKKLVDEDADTKSYDYNTQLKIEWFLEQVHNKLEEEKNEENKIEIEELQKEVIDLKNTQTQLTKSIVVKRLFVIFAKGRKVSLRFAKYLFELGVEKLADAMVKYTIQGPS